MSKKIKSPNEKGHGFLWALVAVLVVAVIVIGYIITSSDGEKQAANGTSTTGTETEAVEIEAGQTEAVDFNVDLHDGYITLSADSADADTPTVDLYEDYSCPHCAELAEATDAEMKDAVTAGDLVVNIHPLNFVAGGDEGHSTRAGTAAMVVAGSGDAELYWNYRKALLENQRKIFDRWTYATFADAAVRLGADDELAEKIRTGGEQGEFEKAASANAEKLKEQTGKVSSPRIIRDGKDVDLNNWVATVAG
ncbi:DsbA family protein [Corynebacterium sp. TAE3-ERU16]|uniref:DsbA family protein n=1 Tax=Corynebacterium sp. TAE3-ERU16 TaxID=2849493 RepID=UPI001C46BA82|nr:thioredoxin domain-containing protein [Corynebacterium sp. TAE3-ERU16]